MQKFWCSKEEVVVVVENLSMACPRRIDSSGRHWDEAEVDDAEGKGERWVEQLITRVEQMFGVAQSCSRPNLSPWSIDAQDTH